MQHLIIIILSLFGLKIVKILLVVVAICVILLLILNKYGIDPKTIIEYINGLFGNSGNLEKLKELKEVI